MNIPNKTTTSLTQPNVTGCSGDEGRAAYSRV